MPGNVAITTSSVPEGFCFTTWTDSWPDLVALLSGNADLSVNLHIGESAPTDLTKVWFKTISGVPDKLFKFASGVWLSKHPDADRIGKTELAPAGMAAADVDTYDGGEAGAVTAFSGPMWEVDTDFAAMFPIGPGTLPSGTVIVEGATGGEENHSLTAAELAPHTHVLEATLRAVGSGAGSAFGSNTTHDSDISTNSAGGTGSPPVVTAHNTMPPYRARFYLKKSARTHYRA